MISIEIIFIVATFVVTTILGYLFKDNIIPSRFIPLQNLIIGIVSGMIALYFNIYNDILLAIILCLASSLSAGGTYDLKKSIRKDGV